MVKKVQPPIRGVETTVESGVRFRRQPLLEDPNDPLIGKVVGSVRTYGITTKIGEGAMGAVYEALDLGSEGNRYAIKFLPIEPDPARWETAKKRFIREMNLALELKHPNIVHAIEFGEHEGRFFYVMDFVEGKDLGKIITEGWDPLKDRENTARMVRIVREICLGLQTAHNKGVVHRDLKLDNVMLADQDDSVKIVDLGLAKLRRRPQTGTHPAATLEGIAVGTPVYMAPEVCAGESVDHRADIYALGILIYKLVAGVFPYDSPDVQTTMLMHMTNEPAKPSTHVSEERKIYAEAFDSLILRAIEKEPENRFQDVSELRIELERAAQSLGINISAVELSALTVETEQIERVREVTPERKRSWVLPAVAALSAVLGFGAVYAHGLVGQKTESEEAPVENVLEAEYPLRITTAAPAVVEIQRKSESGRYWWERLREAPVENVRLVGKQVLRITFKGQEENPMIIETDSSNNVFENLSH